MNDKTSSNTLLIVDDQLDNLKVLLTLLKKNGFSVLVAKSGEESLHVIEHARPDLILLDVMMPKGISGFEVCQRLKAGEATREIPIIFMTALTETVDKVKGFNLGAVDYITKPFQYEELLARVNAHRSIRKLQLELKAQNQLLQKEINNRQKIEDAQQKTHLLLEQTLKSQEHGTEKLEYKTLLKKRNVELDTFSHVFTHDLKTPLNTLTTLGTQLQKNCSSNLRPDAVTTKTLHQVVEAGQLAANIVNTLLLLTGLFREEPVELELLDMSDIVAKVIEERLAHQVEKYQAKIKLAEVWPTVPGYKPWLDEIWMNYISNGLKYGGTPPYLELGVTPENYERVRFWVRDNGIGLTKVEIAKLFTPSDRNEVRTKGKSLGLSLVQQLVERMGGQVGVESTKGKGSLFYFTLPAYK